MQPDSFIKFSILKVIGQVLESQKRIPSDTIRIHLPKPVSTDLTIKSDLVLTNAIGKEGVQDWLM